MPTLSLSLTGLASNPAPAEPAPRRLIERAAAFGLRAIRLDGTMPGLRARELDRSARRDLASLLRRLGLGFGGVDLWIPPEHLADPARTERALTAVYEAIDLCAELATLDGRSAGRTLSLSLPANADEIARQVAEAADRASVRIADHGPGGHERGAGPIGVGIDPAVLLSRDQDPGREVARMADRIVAPRLSDTDGIGRVTPGEGRLDLLAYAIAISSTSLAGADLVLDPRGLRTPDAQIRASIDNWHAVMPQPG